MCVCVCVGILVLNAVALLYCVATMPVELSLWDNLDYCTPVPTLPVDMATDVFFLVTPSHPPSPIHTHTHIRPPARRARGRGASACARGVFS